MATRKTTHRRRPRQSTRLPGAKICHKLTAIGEADALAFKAETMADVLALALRLYLSGHADDEPNPALIRQYVHASYKTFDDASDPEPTIRMCLKGDGPHGPFTLMRVADLARSRLAGLCIALNNRRPKRCRKALDNYGFSVAAVGLLLEDDDGSGWAAGVIQRLTGRALASATCEQALEAVLAFHDGNHLAVLWGARA